VIAHDLPDSYTRHNIYGEHLLTETARPDINEFPVLALIYADKPAEAEAIGPRIDNNDQLLF
jgi:hypothetical protein